MCVCRRWNRIGSDGSWRESKQCGDGDVRREHEWVTRRTTKYAGEGKGLHNNPDMHE